MERLLAIRKLVDDKYTLDQGRLIGTLSSVWDEVDTSTTTDHNDCVRVFDIIMTIEGNIYMYQRLDKIHNDNLLPFNGFTKKLVSES